MHSRYIWIFTYLFSMSSKSKRNPLGMSLFVLWIISDMWNLVWIIYFHRMSSPIPLYMFVYPTLSRARLQQPTAASPNDCAVSFTPQWNAICSASQDTVYRSWGHLLLAPPKGLVLSSPPLYQVRLDGSFRRWARRLTRPIMHHWRTGTDTQQPISHWLLLNISDMPQ